MAPSLLSDFPVTCDHCEKQFKTSSQVRLCIQPILHRSLLHHL